MRVREVVLQKPHRFQLRFRVWPTRTIQRKLVLPCSCALGTTVLPKSIGCQFPRSKREAVVDTSADSALVSYGWAKEPLLFCRKSTHIDFLSFPPPPGGLVFTLLPQNGAF